MRRIMAILILGCLTQVLKGEEPRTAADLPESQFEALVEEFEEAGGAADFAGRFFAFAEQHASHPAAVEALVWILANRRSHPDATRAIGILQKRHVEDKAFQLACTRLATTPSIAAETLLRAAMDRNPDVEVQAHACAALARLLESQASVIDQLQEQPDQAARVLQYYGRDYGGHLVSLNRGDIEQKLERVYERMGQSYSAVTVRGESLGDVASRSLFKIRHLTIGRPAPEIEGEDIFGEVFKLSDYQGKVVVISFWGHW